MIRWLTRRWSRRGLTFRLSGTNLSALVRRHRGTKAAIGDRSRLRHVSYDRLSRHQAEWPVEPPSIYKHSHEEEYL